MRCRAHRLLSTSETDHALGPTDAGSDLVHVVIPSMTWRGESTLTLISPVLICCTVSTHGIHHNNNQSSTLTCIHPPRLPTYTSAVGTLSCPGPQPYRYQQLSPRHSTPSSSQLSLSLSALALFTHRTIDIPENDSLDTPTRHRSLYLNHPRWPLAATSQPTLPLGFVTKPPD